MFPRSLVTRALRVAGMSLLGATLAACGAGVDLSGPIVIDPPPDPIPRFESRGLPGATVLALAQSDNTLLAGTNRGIHRYEGGDRWTLTSPDAWSVRTLEALDASRLLAFVELGQQARLLVESRDGGRNWEQVEHDFGGDGPPQQREPIERLRFRAGSQELFATGYGVLARSLDYGRSWSPVHGDWNRVGTGLGALSFTAFRDDLWYGGQGALEDPVLIRYDRNLNEAVDYSAAIEVHLPRPSTVENVRFYPSSESTVYVMGEGGVIRSTDYGASWEPIRTNDRSRFYFDLAIDDQTGHIFTGGWDKNFTDPQPLILEVSTDAGITWTSYEHADSTLQGGIYSLLLVDLNNRRRLFLGLQGGGVYEVNLSRIG